MADLTVVFETFWVAFIVLLAFLLTSSTILSVPVTTGFKFLVYVLMPETAATVLEAETGTIGDLRVNIALTNSALTSSELFGSLQIYTIFF